MNHYCLCLLGLVLVLLDVANRGKIVTKNASMARVRTGARPVAGSQFVNMADGMTDARPVAGSQFVSMTGRDTNARTVEGSHFVSMAD
jgi:hypothetical protein